MAGIPDPDVSSVFRDVQVFTNDVVCYDTTHNGHLTCNRSYRSLVPSPRTIAVEFYLQLLI